MFGSCSITLAVILDSDSCMFLFWLLIRATLRGLNLGSFVSCLCCTFCLKFVYGFVTNMKQNEAQSARAE